MFNNEGDEEEYAPDYNRPQECTGQDMFRSHTWKRNNNTRNLV
jgi:hypothetical protein